MKPPRIHRALVAHIRRLDLPANAKRALVWLAQRARQLVLAILRLIARHRRFCESILIGVVVSRLVLRLPWIGPYLATIALVVGAVIGLTHELRESLDRLFAQSLLLDG